MVVHAAAAVTTQAVEVSVRRPLKAQIGFVASWAGYLLVLYAMPLPEGMTPAGQATLAVGVWACLTWATEAVPVPLTGLQIPVLLLLAGAVPSFDLAAVGYASAASFICLAAFLMAAVIQCVGLDRRIAFVILNAARVGTVRGVIWAIFVADACLAFIVPGANARGALLLPVVLDITRLLGETAEERRARKAIIIHSLVYGSMVCGLVTLTAGLQNLILVGIFKSELHLDISYLDWLELRWPYLGLALLTQWWIRYWFGCLRTPLPGGRAAVERECRSLPPVSSRERRTLGVFVLTALAWMTEPVHHVPSHLVAALGAGALFIPGLLGLDWAEVNRRTIWGTWLTLCGAVSFSAAMSTSGLGSWLADAIGPVAAGRPWWQALLILIVATHVIRLGILSNVASVALFAPILVSLAPRLGLHPVAFVMLVADANTFAYLLPTQVTVGTIAYASGAFSVSDYAKAGIGTVLVTVAWEILVMAPWFALVGLPIWNPAAPWPF